MVTRAFQAPVAVLLVEPRLVAVEPVDERLAVVEEPGLVVVSAEAAALAGGNSPVVVLPVAAELASADSLAVASVDSQEAAFAGSPAAAWDKASAAAALHTLVA